jgi:AcrR family transcriptional regulator
MDTREKIFEAALIEFSENGYQRTTVRNICTRADVNIAAVNYHFFGKAELYADIFEYLFKKDDRTEPKNSDEAKEYLRCWIRDHIDAQQQESKFFAYKRKIMLKELSESSDNLTVLIEKYIKPNVEILFDCFRLCLPADTPEERVKTLCLLMVAKCIYFMIHTTSIELIAGEGFIGNNYELICSEIIRDTFSLFEN